MITPATQCDKAHDCSTQSQNSFRTGVYGGSFNPIHLGHIAIARQVLQQNLVDEVWFLVSPHNPLKQQSELIDESIRLNLARKALAAEPQMAASDFEFSLPRPSYTWNTLEHLGQAFPMRRFSLIIGGDNWHTFDRWFRCDDILANYPLIVYPRHDRIEQPHRGVTFIKASLLDVSSTMIRQRIREGLSVKGLVPDTILEDVERAYR